MSFIKDVIKEYRIRKKYSIDMAIFESDLREEIIVASVAAFRARGLESGTELREIQRAAGNRIDFRRAARIYPGSLTPRLKK